MIFKYVYLSCMRRQLLAKNDFSNLRAPLDAEFQGLHNEKKINNLSATVDLLLIIYHYLKIL